MTSASDTWNRCRKHRLICFSCMAPCICGLLSNIIVSDPAKRETRIKCKYEIVASQWHRKNCSSDTKIPSALAKAQAIDSSHHSGSMGSQFWDHSRMVCSSDHQVTWRSDTSLITLGWTKIRSHSRSIWLPEAVHQRYSIGVGKLAIGKSCCCMFIGSDLSFIEKCKEKY